MRYRIGDRVWWTSQAGGYATTKHGIIVAVVPARRSPLIGTLPAGCSVRCDSSTMRRHESYLVRVGRRARLYWPRVSDLLPEREDRKENR